MGSPPARAEEGVARRLERRDGAITTATGLGLRASLLQPGRGRGRGRQHVRVPHGKRRERPRQRLGPPLAPVGPVLLQLQLVLLRRLGLGLGLLEEGVQLPPRVEARQLLPPALPLHLSCV